MTELTITFPGTNVLRDQCEAVHVYTPRVHEFHVLVINSFALHTYNPGEVALHFLACVQDIARRDTWLADFAMENARKYLERICSDTSFSDQALRKVLILP